MSITGTGRFTPSFIHFLGTSQSRNFSWRISWKSPNLWFPTSLFSTPFPQSATHTSGGFCRPKCPLGRSICQFTTLVSNFTGKKFKDKNTKLRLKLLLSWKLVQQLDHQWCLTQTLFFQANMHAAFSYDRRDPYARLPLEHVSSANDPSTTSITSVNNVNEHVSPNLWAFDTLLLLGWPLFVAYRCRLYHRFQFCLPT